tara:strand:- start:2798 stop:3244 length:447 start_codon:yes stop_codon:yes gene_type:complete
MNEMQGAVGIAQLKKLDFVVSEQRKNAQLIEKSISGLPIKMRVIPNKSYETSDALVFFVESDQIALECRHALIDAGFGTKILPEAITWHFAGTWNHMQELVNNYDSELINAFPNSLSLLNKSVSLPISIKMPDDFSLKISETLTKVLI